MDENTVQVGESAPETSPSSVADPVQPGDVQDAEETEPQVFDAAYVKALRDEAATNRVRAKRAEDAEARLRDLAIAEAVRGILTDPTDLGWSDDYADEDGWPDADRIRAAAEALVDSKPHLGRPSGEIGQGRHSDTDEAVSLTSLLRAGA